METLDFYESKTTSNDFKDKNVLVTGGRGGIGSEVVRALYKLEANIIVISRSQKEVEKEFQDLIRKKDRLFAEIANLENANNINRTFATVMKKFKGRLDNLIFCHGCFKVGKLTETASDNFDSTININVRSVFHILSMASPFLKISQGNVVVVSSLESMIPVSDSFLNSVSKVRFFCYLGNAKLSHSVCSFRISTIWSKS